MRFIFKKIIEIYLRLITKKIIKKYKPQIIAISGSLGKTSTKNAAFQVIKSKFKKVQMSPGGLNTELGVPLSVMGVDREVENNFSFWFWVIKRALKVYSGKIKTPPVLILEMGVDRPMDMDKLIKMTKPDIAILTNIRSSHLKNFKNKSLLVKEKLKLIQNVDKSGTVIINGDDEQLKRYSQKLRCKVITYGLQKDNLIKARDITQKCSIEEIKKGNWGLSYKLNYRKNIIPINLKKILGKSQVYASLAAVSLGIAMDLSLLDIADSLKNYQSPKGRLNIITGLKNSVIIDDSYNASDPLSVVNGLKILRKTKALKKIAVISDMLELGKFKKKAHLQAAKKALETANVIFTIGERSKIIHNYCRKNSKIKSHIIKHFENKKDLIKDTAEVLNKNCAVYVKGSQGMRMEKVVKALMKEPAKARQFLVRQSSEWLKK
ncbi:MAG: hypothetical protein GF332_03760 [Candidatus Moranbacteria bacterium]|nr:hypothetical protein [Candidatus Moranbacteria bacterium]